MSVLKITGENYEEEVLNSEKKVLIDFYAIIDKVEEKMGDSIKVGKINVDEEHDLAIKYEIMSIPTIVIIKDGKVEKTLVGLRDKSEIEEALK